MKIFYVFLCNRTDHRDDDVLKIRATDHKAAYEKARSMYDYNRFYSTHQDVWGAQEFREHHGEWWKLLKGQEAIS